jgi:hypothetical protein
MGWVGTATAGRGGEAMERGEKAREARGCLWHGTQHRRCCWKWRRLCHRWCRSSTAATTRHLRTRAKEVRPSMEFAGYQLRTVRTTALRQTAHLRPCGFRANRLGLTIAGHIGQAERHVGGLDQSAAKGQGRELCPAIHPRKDTEAQLGARHLASPTGPRVLQGSKSRRANT